MRRSLKDVKGAAIWCPNFSMDIWQKETNNLLITYNTKRISMMIARTYKKDKLMTLASNKYKNMCTKDNCLSKSPEDQHIVELSAEL